DQLQAGEVNVFPYSNTTTCDQPSSAEVCFNNSGTTNENFILNIALGDVAGDLTEVNSSGDVDFSGGNASIVFDELDAGEVECVNIVWQNPDFNSLGENININADLNIVVDGEEQNLASTNFSTELTCAYDPNDKRVWPEGEYEQNYVPIGTSIDYMIRFQNTGNGNATNVVLRDTLDENLNELSFLLKGQSHNMLFEFDHTSREMVFTFPNINLPPSESDEPGSHGFVSFELSHNEDLIATTPVTNTAHIYFDANPAIVTNTTLTTFYNCDDFFASFDTDLIPHCAGTSAELVSFTPDAESFLWQLDGQTISESGTCDLSDLSLGGHTLSLEVDHPLCQANNSVFFEVIDCGNSISEITTALGPIVVFPNPCSSETVNIKLPSRPSKRSELLIFNSFGQEVLRMAKSNVNDELIQINVHELPKGLYFIQFIENGTSRTARMIL
ncbi:MAG: T9SS type A sorting domain-containing protein, partial [Flavobacteriales bacterium]